MSHGYKLTYHVDPHPEGVPEEQIPPDSSASDALFVVSLIFPPDGSLSTACFSFDGRNGDQLSPKEEFKAWLMAGLYLSGLEQLDEGRRDFAKRTVDSFWKSLGKAES